MLESGRPADAKTVKHIDRCLSCLSCMTTCPSGVHYMHLVDHARAHIERTYRRPWPDRTLRSLLAAILPYPARFRLALRAARLGRPFAEFLPVKLRGMLALAPRSIPPRTASGGRTVFPAEGPRLRRVALLTGCAQSVLAPGINDATIRLLTRRGCEVVVAGDGCCGALPHHMGKTDASHALAAQTVAAWMKEVRGEGLDAIVINTSGCGTTVKDYGTMLAGTPLAADATRIAALARDITELMTEIGLGPVAPGVPPLRVAYHAACSLQHGQQIRLEPKALLQTAGFTVVQPRDAHLCCGSAGTYNLLQPEISAELRRRKVQTLKELGPQVIAGGNLGCLMQIGAGTSVPVVHTVELLDWATGGPRPAALAGLEEEPGRPLGGPVAGRGSGTAA